MKLLSHTALFSLLCLFWACQPAVKETSENTPAEVVDNPAAPGFDLAGSDQEAIMVADQVMAAMGGRAAWDQTRYLCWDFFGARHLIWDKQDQRVRIEAADSTTYLLDMKDMTGRVMKKEVEITQPDSVAKYLEQGKNIWINDSYWLVMPFKLKDSGVTLKYHGEALTKDGDMAEVLQLTFKEVGRTPENKYLVYVDKESSLVTQWSYYNQAEQDSANFVLPWGNYQTHGSILLSDDRGDRDLNEVMVLDSLPNQVFETFDPVSLNEWITPN